MENKRGPFYNSQKKPTPNTRYHRKNCSQRERPQNSPLAKKRMINYKIVVIQKISSQLAKQTLVKHQYLGQYGKIQNLAITQNKEKETTAYVNFQNQLSAAFALKGLNFFRHNGSLLQTMYGTNRYCFSVIKKIECIKQHCQFSHRLMENESFKPLPTLNDQEKYAAKIIQKNLPKVLGSLATDELPIIKMRSVTLKKTQSSQIFPTIPEILAHLLELGDISKSIYEQKKMDYMFNLNYYAMMKKNEKQNENQRKIDWNMFNHTMKAEILQEDSQPNLEFVQKRQILTTSSLVKALQGKRKGSSLLFISKIDQNPIIDKQAERVKNFMLKNLKPQK